MLQLPTTSIPIQEIKYKDFRIFIKREDLIHPEISGNKYWKLFYNVNSYLGLNKRNPLVITFGGAFSNHIAAVSAFGKLHNIPTLGIIRGEELENNYTENPTLKKASANGMQLKFVSRESYRDKEKLTHLLTSEFPDALIIPEGGSNLAAVQGLQYMLNVDTKDFDYLCIAVGTGGSIAGISQFAEEHQQIIGFPVVKDDSLPQTVKDLGAKVNFSLIDAAFDGYGKISDEVVRFINEFWKEYKIPLDPIYSGKMMMKLFQLIDDNFFDKKKSILAFHTGGLQGIEGANQFLKNKNRNTIDFKS